MSARAARPTPGGAGDATASPPVSVVIPVYRQAEHLAEALASVAAQDVAAEVIVVDDGSPGGIRDAVPELPGVRLIERPHEGVSAARNAGLEACRGRYVVFLDADDRLLPGCLEAGLACIAAHPDAGFVFGRYRFIREDGAYAGEPGMPPPDEPDYLELVRGNFVGMLAAVLFPTGRVRAVGGFRPELAVAEDYDLLLRLARRHPIFHHRAHVAEYRRYATSASADAGRMLGGVLEVLAHERAAALADANRARPEQDTLRAFEDGVRFFKTFYGVRLARQIVRENLLRGRFRGARDGARHLLHHLGPALAFVYLPPAVLVAGVRKTWWIARGWWHRVTAGPLTRAAR